MSEQNKAVVRHLFDSWNDKSQARVDEVITATTSVTTPDGVFTGLDGAAALQRAYATGFPDFHNAIEEMVAEGDKVVVKWTFTGTNRGPLADIPATGKRVKVTNGIGIYRVVAGKITEGTMTWNKYALLEQLGVVGG